MGTSRKWKKWKRWTIAGAVLCAAWHTACGRTATAPEEDPTDMVLARVGSGYFAQYCAACHGATAQGDGPAAAALSTPPADLTRIAARRGGTFPEAEVARTIDGRFRIAAHGTREMPVWGERFGEQIPEPGVSDEIVRGRILILVEYLKSIQRTE